MINALNPTILLYAVFHQIYLAPLMPILPILCLEYLFTRLLENLGKFPRVRVVVVQGRRSDPDDVRPALVDNDALRLQLGLDKVEHAGLEQQTQLCASLLGHRRSDERVGAVLALLARHVVEEEVLKVGRQMQRLGAQVLHRRLAVHGQRRQHRRAVEDALVAQAEARRAGQRHELAAHAETRALLATPPAAQAWPEAQALLADLVAALGGRRDVAVALVDEESADDTWPAVHVLVVAPRGEVDVPVVQLQRHVADGVGEVPADGDAALLGVGGDGGDVEELARVVLDAREEQQGGAGGVGVDYRENVRGGEERAVWFGGVEFDEGLRVVEVVQVQLRLDGVLPAPMLSAGDKKRGLEYKWPYVIAGEGLALNDDFVPLLGWPVETCHEQVQVCREGLHDGDFALLRAHNLGHLRLQVLLHVDPGAVVAILQLLPMAVDALDCPGVEVPLHIVPRPPRLQSERVTTQVGAFVSCTALGLSAQGLDSAAVGDALGPGVVVGGDDELFAELAKRVLRIE